MGYIHATYVLLKKNTLLSVRDSGALIVTLLAAFLSMLVLYFNQISINNGDGFNPSLFENRNPTPEDISFIPRCVPLTFDDCYTIAYVPESNEDVKRWVDQVRTSNAIPSEEVRGFENDDALNQFLLQNPNRTQAAYIFDQDSLDLISDGNIQFIVQYNLTRQADFPFGFTAFHTQVVVPSMIHQMNRVLMPEASGKEINFDLKVSAFPHPDILSDTGDGFGLDAFGQYGPLLTFGVYFLSVVFFLYKIVDEKERGLRDAMKLAGQYQSQHYISWCVPYIIMIFFLTMLLIAFGHAFSFRFFTENDFLVYFLTMFIFGLSLIGWTVLVAPLTGKAQSVSTVAFNLFIFGYLIASFTSVVYEVDGDGEPIIGENVLFLRKLFAIAPSTMFVKALEDGSFAPLTGTGLTFETAGTYTDVFPIKDCWLWMLGSGAVAFVLGVYLDNVRSSRHGAPLPPYYFLLPKYWGFRKSNYQLFPETSDDSSPESEEPLMFTEDQSYDPNTEDADVRIEREAVANGEKDHAALVIKNITKKFGKFVAVDDVSFSVEKNTAFALLGHNGAGKSTLFNMLVTSLKPTEGDAFIFGKSVRQDQADVRKLLGVCPQFDIFWDKLTGGEHVEIFGALKGMKGAALKKEIDLRLEDVFLTEKKNVYAGAYSGGMQRRLSVALSLTGDPKIILLDECTSGADPLVRRDLWGTIDRAKKGRVVFMITHSIAEAQHIAGHNSIGIMAKGKLRVLGNALRLKSKFGAGYRLLVVLQSDGNANRVKDALNGICPGTTLASVKEGENGHILADYSMPRIAGEPDILRSINMLEEYKESHRVVDYSLNSATLGEVFKSITSLSEDVQEDEHRDEGNGVRRKRCGCL